MSKIKQAKLDNAKVAAITKNKHLLEEICILPERKEKRMEMPSLRWLCVKEPTFWRGGEFILQYKAEDGNWYEVPEVTLDFPVTVNLS